MVDHYASYHSNACQLLWSNGAGDIIILFDYIDARNGCIRFAATKCLFHMQAAAVRLQALYRGITGRSAANRRKVGLCLYSAGANESKS